MSIWLRKRLHDDEGISLVEIMVGVLIIGIALAAFAGTVTQALANITRDEQHVRGNQCGADILEGLRVLPYDKVGFYADDAGYAASFTDPDTGETLPTVTLGASRGGDTVAPVPTSVVPCDGVDHTLALDIVWRDDPERPAPPASDPDPNDYKEIRATLDWTVQDRDFSTTQIMVRQPTLDEVGHENDDPTAAGAVCTPGEMTRFDISPSFVGITASGTTTDAVTVTVETCTRSSLVVLTPTPLAQRSMTEVPGSDGTRWTVDDFPAGTTDFTAGTYTWVADSSGTDGTDVESREIRFAQLSDTPLEILGLTLSPTAPICTVNGLTHSNVTMTAEITGAAVTDPVRFSWTADAGSVSGTYLGSGASGTGTWTAVLPAGTPLRNATTSLTVSVTRNGDGLQVSEAYVIEVLAVNNPARCRR